MSRPRSSDWSTTKRNRRGWPGPTPEADINALLHALITEIQNILGPELRGLYIYGSLALGDFDPETYWLWEPHRALVRARNRALQTLADAFQNVFHRSIDRERNDPGSFKVRTGQMMEIQRQYDFIDDTFPTWPLPRSTVRSLLATGSLPTVSSILSFLVPLVFSKAPDLLKSALELISRK